MQINNKNIVFAINSTANFFHLSLQKILKSLIDAGVHKNDILIVIGGFDDPNEASSVEVKLRNLWQIPKIYATKQNSCDHTLFNFLIQRPETFANFDYLFYLHDTCWVGPSFVDRLKQLTPEEHLTSFQLIESWSMNIGLYNIKQLLDRKEDIKKAFNEVNTFEAVNYWKQWGAETEDYLMQPNNGYYAETNKKESVVLENPYGMETARRTRYFDCLDLYKSQSNWNGVQNQMNVKL
jgi:predicted MPP superfamily phosphohydrolase